MIRPRTYMQVLITTAAAFALSACVVHPNQSSDPYSNTPENAQSTVAPGPYYYRGTTNNTAPMNNDASISANVIHALNTSAGMGSSTGAGWLGVSTALAEALPVGVEDGAAGCWLP